MAASRIPEDESTIEQLRSVELRMAKLERGALREELRAIIANLRDGANVRSDAPKVDAALRFCRILYHHARSAEGLALARAALAAARRIDDAFLVRRSATVCGVLSGDTLDLVGAIEYHVLALRVATAAGDAVECARVWNGIGLAMGISGHYELASRCYRRTLQVLEGVSHPTQPRYTALMNLAMCLHRIGESTQGLGFALDALKEETPGIRAEDAAGPLYLRRNLVTLLVACGRVAEAELQVQACASLANSIASPRAQIGVATARAAYELATGKIDVALTRLESALAQARQVPASLRDTLVSIIQAEEAAGNTERALVRLKELSDHVYRHAVDRAREHVELDGLGPDEGHPDGAHLQARARLVEKLPLRDVPEAWDTLDRLATSATLPVDASGFHGKRVGTLVRALAIACGAEPLEALEMGLAARIHDIGLLSVPDGILRNVTSFNDAERAIVRRHVEAGVEMLGDDRHPRIFVAREIARYHHARWDGEGHPAVAGKRIPLVARTCAVADAYDAMVCGIGGRKPKSMEEALAELRAESGGQFDPELVDRFDVFIRSETEDLGMDFASCPGMNEFHSLVNALQQDRGFA